MIEAVKTVAAAFFGVRRHSSHQRDTAAIRPVHVVASAILLVALFIGTLLTIVRFVVG